MQGRPIGLPLLTHSLCPPPTRPAPMNSTSLPEDWRSQLAGYVLNDLTPEKAVLVEHWLGQYPEVAAELETLQTTWESLPNGLEPVVPPPGVRDRILTAVQPMISAPAPPPGRDPSRRRFPWVRLGLGWAATALALVTTLQENQRLRLALRQSEAVVASFSQPANRLFTLTGTEAEPQASGRLVVNPTDQTALIITTDLPPPRR